VTLITYYYELVVVRSVLASYISCYTLYRLLKESLLPYSSVTFVNNQDIIVIKPKYILYVEHRHRSTVCS